MPLFGEKIKNKQFGMKGIIAEMSNGCFPSFLLQIVPEIIAFLWSGLVEMSAVDI